MDPKKHLINVRHASRLMDCTIQNIYDLIKRLALKAVKRNRVLYTCEEWIEEYYEHKRSKDFHSSYNGRKVFDESKGELSIRMIEKEYGLPYTALCWWIRVGKLHTVKKGAYHVVMKAELERFMAEDLKHYELEKEA